MSAYFPDQMQGKPVFPKPIGNYDETGYQGMDKTIVDTAFSTFGYFFAQASTVSNVAIFAASSNSPTSSINSAIPYDRQFPDITETHKCRLVSLTVKLELIKGALATATGNVVVALVPPAESWGGVTGPLWGQETLSLMHGSSVITAAELAQQPVTITFARVGSLCDSFKSSTPMSLAFSKAQISRISGGAGFTHNIGRIRQDTLPGVVGDNFTPTLDVLVPMVVANFSSDVVMRMTIIRYWDLELMPQDTSVMTGVNTTGRIKDDTAQKLVQITHALPVLPSPTAALPAEAIVDSILKVVEKGGKWIADNKDNIRTAANVFGTTVSIGAKLAPLLL